MTNLEEITLEHHKQRIKDYRGWLRVNAFRLQVCGDHQIKSEKIREKTKDLTEKLDI